MSPSEVPLEKKYHALCNILRAQHFAWREAVKRSAAVPVGDVVRTMWSIAGQETAEAFRPAIDMSRPLAPQVAEAVARSLSCMGQDGGVDMGKEGDAYVSQSACPWWGWNQRHRCADEDRAGCDAWYDGMVGRLNERLGTRLAVDSCASLPDGDACCRRHIYVDELPNLMDW